MNAFVDWKPSMGSLGVIHGVHLLRLMHVDFPNHIDANNNGKTTTLAGGSEYCLFSLVCLKSLGYSSVAAGGTTWQLPSESLEVKGELGSEWLTITIDEKIPCHAGTMQPRFAQANSREIWVLLMEKAFAKMYGGYDKLEGPLVLLHGVPHRIVECIRCS